MKIEKTDKFPGSAKYSELYNALSEMEIENIIRIEIENNVNRLRSAISNFSRANNKKFRTVVEGEWLYIKRSA